MTNRTVVDGFGVNTYYETTLNMLQEQMQRVDSMDAKISSTFAVTSGLFALLGAALVMTGKSGGVISAAMYGTAAALYLLLVWYSAEAYRGGAYTWGPKLTDLQEICFDNDEETARAWVASMFAKSVAENEPLLSAKAAQVRNIVSLVVLVGALLGASDVSAWVGG